MKLALAFALFCLGSDVTHRATTVQESARATPRAPTVFVGRVLDAQGVPARGARVTSSAGGEAVTAADGSFELAADVPLDAECVELSVAGVAARGASLVANARVQPAALSPTTPVGTLQLVPGPPQGAPRWLPTVGEPSGILGEIYDLLVFDDGGGSALYAAGIFSEAGVVQARGIARWDGRRWSPPGTGIGAYQGIIALEAFDDGDGPALYVGGLFTSVDNVAANRIARWNGATWTPLGSGMNQEVCTLAVFDDGSGPALYAGGKFTTAGGAAASHIARWNGDTWSALGAGTDGNVRSLAVFDDGGGPALYVGGEFTTAGGVAANQIARWDGASWSALGSGMDDDVNALQVFDDGGGPDLYAAGRFTSAGGASAHGVARWNGAGWSALGSGLAGPLPVAHALTVYDDGSGPALLVGGPFTSAGGVSANSVAAWDGAEWRALESGYPASSFTPSTQVRALAVYDDGHGPVLCAGGDFTSAGGVPTRSVARWKGGRWTTLGRGMNSVVGALGVFDLGEGPELVVSGEFTSVGGNAVTRIARREAGRWEALGSGLGGSAAALAVFDAGNGPELFAGGTFMTAGGVTANRIARWDGTSWSGVGTGASGGIGSPGVRALAVFDAGSGPALYAGGNFTGMGGVPASRIARWNGASWSALGSGVDGAQEIFALAVYDDGAGPALYAGGNFFQVGGVAARGIAKWNGSSWSHLGFGTHSGEVRALAVYDDGSGPALYAAGNFLGMSNVNVTRIAKWDGTTWSPLGSGIGTSAVYALCVYDDGDGSQLYAGGAFHLAGGVAVDNVARWDGSQWSAVGAGVEGNGTSAVSCFAVHDAGSGPLLFVGGTFEESPAGDCYLSRWGTPSKVGRAGF